MSRPLYFQHDGHSRTIVGIQMQKGFHGTEDRFFLLIFDPSHVSPL
jgi:zinc finger-containing ubiquitin peptidase 1